MSLEIGLCALTVVGMGLGSWSLYWARGCQCRVRNSWGRRLFLLTLGVLAVSTVPAYYFETRILTWLGLCLGLLIAAMLWDVPNIEEPPSTERTLF